MSAQELTNAIAKNTEKRLLRKSAAKLPQRCRYHAMCGQAATRWAWHTHMLKLLGVCQHCFETNEWLVQPKQKRS